MDAAGINFEGNSLNRDLNMLPFSKRGEKFLTRVDLLIVSSFPPSRER
jgi:hypothetical protein